MTRYAYARVMPGLPTAIKRLQRPRARRCLPPKNHRGRCQQISTERPTNATYSMGDQQTAP